MRLRELAVLSCLTLGCALGSGSAAADTPNIKKVESLTPVSVAERPKVAAAKFARMRTTIPLNDPIGTHEEGIFCTPKAKLVMTQKLWTEVMMRAAGRAYRNEMRNAGYPSAVQSESAFDEAPKTESDFDFGAVVRKTQLHVCTRGKEGQGAVYVEVKWELYYKKARKVVYETVTEGSYEAPQMETSRLDEWYERAFAVSLRNMLADPKFGDILAGATPLPDAVAQPAAEKIMLAAAAPLEGGVSSNVPMLQAAVVTIVNGTIGGSGFFVNDGYLITNQHVVRDSKFVKVKLATGREIVGEVLRSDARRDVALIKTESIGARTLGVRVSEPNVGEDVYAIGSPLHEKLSGTMTKGILSGHRIIAEQRWLQSDVAILPGNSGGPLLDASGRVIGISCRAVASGMANLNFFVPIGDAMSKLDLSVKE